MTIENEPEAPAGADDGASAPLSVSAAAELLLKREETPANDATQTTDEQDAGAAAAEEGVPAKAGTEGDAEPAETGNDETAPEDQSLDFDKLHGNTKLRLRDGSEVTVGELKKRWGDLQDVGKTRAQIDADRQKFEADKQQINAIAAQIAQRGQLFQQVLPQAIAALQAQLPEVPALPDPSLAETDTYEYNRKLAAHLTAKAHRDAKLAEIGQLQRAHSQQQADQAREQQSKLETYIAAEHGRLIEAIPELRDKAKAQEFLSDFTKYGQEYGFNEAELHGVYDSRLMRMARDAIAWRKLQAQPKPKPVAKTQPAGQVAQPGRRVSGQERAQASREELMDRARKSGGSMRDIAAIVEQLG